MGFISNQLEGAFKAGTAHKELAAQLFRYCRENKDSIGSEGYWQMFTMPNADLGELAKSIKYLPKKNGNYCVELADVNFYFKTESDAGPLLPPTIYIMKETTSMPSESTEVSSSKRSSAKSTLDQFRQMGMEIDPALANLMESIEDDDEDPEEKERRAASARRAAASRKAAEARAKEKAEEIKDLPMPDQSAIVFELKECKLYAEQAQKTEKGKAAKIISEAWMNRQQLIVEYGKIHYANDAAFLQYLADEEAERKRIAEEKRQKKEEHKQKVLAKRDELQKHLKPQKIHRWVFWGIYLLSAIITFCSIEGFWAWLLAIIIFIVLAVGRFFVHVTFDDDDYDLEKIEEAIKSGKYEDIDVN